MHTPDFLKQLSAREKDPRLKIRYLALHHFSLGENRTQIAKYLGVTRTSVNRWVSSYLSNELDGLISKKSSGRPHRLSDQQKSNLQTYIIENAVKNNGGRLIAEDIRVYIQDVFNVQYTQRNIYHLLQDLGFSWITSRSKHPKQSEEAQEAFKKITI